MSATLFASVFQEFSWLRGDLQNDRAAVFAARIKDLGFGMHKCLQLVEASELDRAHSEGEADADAPLLNVYDTGVLLRLAVTTAQIIGEQAEAFLVAQERCTKAQSTALSSTEGGSHRG